MKKILIPIATLLLTAGIAMAQNTAPPSTIDARAKQSTNTTAVAKPATAKQATPATTSTKSSSSSSATAVKPAPKTASGTAHIKKTNKKHVNATKVATKKKPVKTDAKPVTDTQNSNPK